MAGPKSKEVCGKAFNDLWDGEYDLNDRVGPLFSFEPHNRSKDWPPECKWYLCQGKQFEDNKDNVYTFSVGHHLHLEIFILAAHEGTANISVVDLEKNEVIPGAQLRYWGEGYAKLRTYGDGPYPPADQVNFVVEMPNLDGQCSQPGQCAIQWWWWGKQSARDQYYESCIDFVQPQQVTVDEGGAQEVFGAPQGHHGH
ncbi:hypothetical protein [Phaffia rhodozyma]|uniref:Chitin-binding type-4 domain-containing protein n=1 Tax=Phaffia rhodozyma TaxID=264483 RepID=A0A0F7SS25_PHARH|nr:hypothetical protein [Phaffia rhodozyma]